MGVKPRGTEDGWIFHTGRGGSTAGDIQVVTSDGKSFSAHSHVLASASPVLERIILERPRRRGGAGDIVHILGVPSNAAAVFIRCIYSPRYVDQEQMEKYGLHLLVLSHVMQITWLKKAAETVLTTTTLSVENVVDMMQVARLCNAPRLFVKCLNLAHREFEEVWQTDGWQFIHRNDPGLELEVVKFIREAEMRKKKFEKRKEEELMYKELSEAMKCLHHIYSDGCGNIMPHGASSLAISGQCRWGHACEGLQGLIRHFAKCADRKDRDGFDRGCRQCGMMLQLIRLHSIICKHQEGCKVPLCWQFKMKAKISRKEEGKWELLGKKLTMANLVSSLSRRQRIRKSR